MSGATSMVRAEKMALGGNNESQDSQQVLDAYMKIYGIGLVSVCCLWRPARCPGSTKPGAVPRPIVLTSFGATDEQFSATGR